MLKAEELRIGNWVNVIKIHPVQITADHIKSIVEGDKDYSPIPITPEIIEAAGFVEHGIEKRVFFKVVKKWKLYSFRLIKSEDDVFYLQDIGDRLPSISIEYLHQLQNLYFALTSQELTINIQSNISA